MTIKLYNADCLAILPTLAENSIDSVVTDPPYGLSDQSSDNIVECLSSWIAGKPYVHNKKGFMGKDWDGWVPGPEIWKEVFRVLKPGGHLVAFASTRTYDLMAISLRLAGFEIRDQLCWLHSQGMPHGMNISKAIDKMAGAERKIIGTKINTYDGSIRNPDKHGNPADQSNIGKYGLTKTPHGMLLTEAATDEAKEWEGWHTALKPSMEPIVLAIKPHEGNIAQNVLKYGVGGLNIDESRIPVDMEIDDPRLGGHGSWSTEGMAKNTYGNFSGERSQSSAIGRFPSNVIHSGEEEVLEIFDSFGEKTSGVPGKRQKEHSSNSMGKLGIIDRDHEIGYADKGSVARFYNSCEFSEEEKRIFYCPKVSPKERGNSKHPTLKPIKIMEYLCKLITPKGGMVLDPFCGSGTTGEAAANLGFSSILIEKEEEYHKDAIHRLALWLDE
jgi:DNA modification methylase